MTKRNFYHWFQAHMKFPLDYPYSPPSIRFLTKVWHPNVYEVSQFCGRHNLNMDKNWSWFTQKRNALSLTLLVVDVDVTHTEGICGNYTFYTICSTSAVKSTSLPCLFWWFIWSALMIRSLNWKCPICSVCDILHKNIHFQFTFLMYDWTGMEANLVYETHGIEFCRGSWLNYRNQRWREWYYLFLVPEAAARPLVLAIHSSSEENELFA